MTVDCTLQVNGGSVSVPLITGGTGSAAVGRLMPRLHQKKDVPLHEDSVGSDDAVARAAGDLAKIPGLLRASCE